MRREEKRKRTRRSILEAAVRVFARKGVLEARISDIAQEAGVGHGTVYLYFKGKNGILHAIHEELMAHALREVKEYADQGKDAEDQFGRLIEALHRMVQENLELTKLVLIEAQQTSEFLQSQAIVPLAEFIEYIQELLRRGVEEGRFRPEVADPYVATFVFAGIEGILTRWLLEGQREPLAPALLKAYAVLTDGLRLR